MKNKTQSITLNLNKVVQVKLTDFGWSVYENYMQTTLRPKMTKGYITLPFAKLMNIFGDQLNDCPYDERIAVFVNNEIITNVPNTLIHDMFEKINVEQEKCRNSIMSKWDKKMRSFKAGDKVVKTIGSDKQVYTYKELVWELGSEAHEIVSDDGRVSIVYFHQLDYA